MATKGTRNTAIAFGSYEIQVSMVKANGSRDLKTEVVDEEGATVGGGGNGGRRALRDGQSKAVRITETEVVRLPAEDLERIVDASKKSCKSMQVLDVIDYRQVPTERIVGGYWLQPAYGSVKGLALLAAALRETGGVALVKWISTSREKLGVIRVRSVGRKGQVALLLSELSFANDFMQPDADALSINDYIEELDSRELQQAKALLDAYSRDDDDDEALIDTASDTAVDARIALFERLRDRQVRAQLKATKVMLDAAATPMPADPDVSIERGGRKAAA